MNVVSLSEFFPTVRFGIDIIRLLRIFIVKMVI